MRSAQHPYSAAAADGGGGGGGGGFGMNKCFLFEFSLFFAHFFSSKLIDSSRRDVERWQELLLVNVFECNIRFVARSRMTIDFNFIFVLLLGVFVLCEVGDEEKKQKEWNEIHPLLIGTAAWKERSTYFILDVLLFFSFVHWMWWFCWALCLPLLVWMWSQERKFKRFLFRRQYDVVVHLFIRMHGHTQTQTHTQVAAEQTQMMSNMFGPLKMELGSSWIKFESDKITTQMKHINDVGGDDDDNNKNTNRNYILGCDDTAHFCGVIFSNFYFNFFAFLFKNERADQMAK